MVKIIIDKLK